MQLYSRTHLVHVNVLHRAQFFTSHKLSYNFKVYRSYSHHASKRQKIFIVSATLNSVTWSEEPSIRLRFQRAWSKSAYQDGTERDPTKLHWCLGHVRYHLPGTWQSPTLSPRRKSNAPRLLLAQPLKRLPSTKQQRKTTELLRSSSFQLLTRHVAFDAPNLPNSSRILQPNFHNHQRASGENVPVTNAFRNNAVLFRKT